MAFLLFTISAVTLDALAVITFTHINHPSCCSISRREIRLLLLLLLNIQSNPLLFLLVYINAIIIVASDTRINPIINQFIILFIVDIPS